MADLGDSDLVLVRHARPVTLPGVRASEWVMDDGAAQDTAALAQEVAGLLTPFGRRVSSLWSSTEAKAVGTAEVLGDAWGLDVRLLEGLGEHRRGPLPFVGAEEWRQTIARMFDMPSEVVLGLESADDALSRFTEAIRFVLAAGDGAGPCAVATHATVMTLLVARPNGIAPMELWGSLGMPDALFVDSRRDFRLLGRAWRRRP